MKILLLADDLEIGGVSRVVVQIARGLIERGIQVGVFAGPGQLWDSLPAECARHPSPSRFRTPAFLRALRRVVAEGGYTILHPHQRGVALLSRIAFPIRQLPIVEHVHNVFRRSLIAPLSFRGDRLIACGTAVRRMLIDEYRRPADRITVIVNGVADSGQDIVPIPCLRGEELGLVAVGRLVEQKDPLRFVELVAALSSRLDRPLRATWVGDGPLRPDVESAVAQRGLASRFEFAGTRDDVAAYLRDSDALVLTSRWEGLPLVILEAMAAGRAVFASDVGSCSDAVATGATGMLYPVDLGIERLADTIAAALVPDTLAEWGRAGRDVFEREFTVDRVVDEVVDIYRSVAAPAAG